MKYGLIGEKLAHSYSKQVHNQLGLADYQLLELPTPDAAREYILHGEWLGLNVTIPYKLIALQCCDEIDGIASRIGAVNTLVRRSGKIYGYNTDYAGFEAMSRKLSIAWHGTKVLILGGHGGAGRMVHTAAVDFGALNVIDVSRSGPVTANIAMKCHQDADIIVNATPCGMFPNCADSPIDLSQFRKLTAVLDLIYNPEETVLLHQARTLGIPCVNGMVMLVEQARHAERLFGVL